MHGAHATIDRGSGLGFAVVKERPPGQIKAERAVPSGVNGLYRVSCIFYAFCAQTLDRKCSGSYNKHAYVNVFTFGGST